MRRLVSLTAAVATIAPLSMLPATGTAHAMTVPLGGTCPTVDALNSAARNEPLNVTDITGPGAAGDPTASLYRAAQWIGATSYYNGGYFGKGVDVALIDSGVTPVKGLDSGNVVQGPDFSFESQAQFAQTPTGADHSYANPDLLHNDGYGHGTHIAGAIAGRDDTDPQKVGGTYTYVNGQITYQPLTHTPYSYNDPTKFTGIAPGARVVSLKVADSMGGNDVTQVIAAIDWAVKHAHTDGLNIRVINLSYGIANGSYDDSTMDALSYAVDQAWKAGIVVVAAAGNGGKATVSQDPGLNSPGFNRDIITVGSYDNGTLSSGKATVPSYSSGSSSTNMRLPDVSAPGSHLLSLHVPGASADDEIVTDCQKTLNPPANDPDYPGPAAPWTAPLKGNDRFVKASGTSQATGVVSGAIALILSRDPNLTPDQIKALLRQTADATIIANGSRRITGEGSVSLGMFMSKLPNVSGLQLQKNNPVTGGYGLDIARGYDYLWNGKYYTREAYPGTCDPKSSVYNDALCYKYPSPGSQLIGNTDIFGSEFNVANVQAFESIDKSTGKYTNGQNGPWIFNWMDGGETYGFSYFRVGAKSIDAFGNPTWGAVPWGHALFDGTQLTALDWSGRRLVYEGAGSLNARSWRTDGLVARSWRDFGFQARSWKDFGLTARSWKDHGWRDNLWG